MFQRIKISEVIKIDSTIDYISAIVDRLNANDSIITPLRSQVSCEESLNDYYFIVVNSEIAIAILMKNYNQALVKDLLNIDYGSLSNYLTNNLSHVTKLLKLKTFI